AIGIAAMTLIAALAGGLQGALASPALARSQLHQLAICPTADASGFSSGPLATVSQQPHVRAAWGQVAMTGTFAVEDASGSPVKAVKPTGALVSLPPRSSSPELTLMAGRLPRSDSSAEMLLTDRTAMALGFKTAAAALGSTVDFNSTSGSLVVSGPPVNPVTSPLFISLPVAGGVSSQYMPAGASGALIPYSVATDYWAKMAQFNGWKTGEYANITLL